MYDYDALAAWEIAEQEKNTKRIYKTRKNYVCPRKEKHLDYRNYPGKRRDLLREDACVKKATIRAHRRFLKAEIENEAYYRSHNRDYRSGGWISW